MAEAVETGIFAHLERYGTELEEIFKDRDMRGLHQHPKKLVGLGLGGTQSGGKQFATGDNGVLLRNKDDILQRWARFFGTLLNTRVPHPEPTLNPDAIDKVTLQLDTPATQGARTRPAGASSERPAEMEVNMP